MNLLLLAGSHSAWADIAIPQGPLEGRVAEDLPPPEGPPGSLDPLVLGGLSVGFGLVLVAVLWTRRGRGSD